jgi:AraC family transcriptional activator FtrA
MITPEMLPDAAPSPTRTATPPSPTARAAAERVRRAQDLLENTDDTIERIATRCGFGSAQQMRTHFTRISNVTPHAYQLTFRSRATA